MGRDHSDAFVRLFFDGLIAFCFNRNQAGRCEMGMVQVNDHEPLLRLTRIHPNGTETVLNEQGLSPQDEISIVAENPLNQGTSRFERNPFVRVRDTGDEEDFRWIADLQDRSEFHGLALKPRQGGSSDTLLRPRIFIPHGIFYTQCKSQDFYFRTTRVGNAPFRPLGKIADRVGADIVCGAEGGRVTVTIGASQPFTLLRDEGGVSGYRYTFEITNLCRTSSTTCPEQSDFPHYYKAFQDDNSVEFDLLALFAANDPRGKRPAEESLGPLPPQFKGFMRNGPPQVCNSVFLSETNTIT